MILIDFEQWMNKPAGSCCQSFSLLTTATMRPFCSGVLCVWEKVLVACFCLHRSRRATKNTHWNGMNFNFAGRRARIMPQWVGAVRAEKEARQTKQKRFILCMLLSVEWALCLPASHGLNANCVTLRNADNLCSFEMIVFTFGGPETRAPADPHAFFSKTV